MKQNKRGILMFASMILSISLMYGVQAVKAADGDLIDTDGILLNDTDSNGKIDEVQITVNYAVATADAIAHATDIATTIGKFTVTDTGTDSLVTISSMEFVSGDGTIAIFKLLLDEANVSDDTSETALDIIYNAVDSDLKITSGSVDTSDLISVIVATIGDVTDEDEDEDEDENENGEVITPPDGSLPGPATPNINSGVTLYRMPGDPRVYVIKNKKKHWIQTPKEFNENGYNWGKVKIVSAEVLEGYPDDIEDSTTELLRAVGSHKVYKIENGKRRWIKTAEEFNATGYKWKDIKDVPSETLASYQDLVSSGLIRATGSHKVYIIENGKKHWIKTAGEFNAAGHRWGDVENVSVATLDSYSDLE